MPWNWELPDWPKFSYDSSAIVDLERKFLQAAGGGFMVLKYLDNEKKKEFIIETLCSEGIKSAEIEGEILERASLRSSIQKHFGLDSKRKILPREKGMSDLLWSVFDTYSQDLTHEMLYQWHRLLLSYDFKIEEKGKYRTHQDSMQIIANRLDRRIVHFEAPPSKDVYKEMTRFIKWFNRANHHESPLIRAAIAHVYFESIHPFEDGNGRIGRALVEKVLSQGIGHPTLIAVSSVISRRKKEYYQKLSLCNRTLNIQEWLLFFTEVILQAQEESLAFVNFLMVKSQMMHRLEGHINSRQEKVLLRIFAEGISGFVGGLSAENYMAITKTSRATATRDLADLVEKGALYKTGQFKHTRYWLNCNNEKDFFNFSK